MNDVKISNIDFMAKQAKSTSAPSAESGERGRELDASSASSGATLANNAVSEGQRASNAEQAEKDGAASKEESVQGAVAQLNDYVQNVQRDLQFKLDDDSGKTVVTVIDRETAEVVRQIPDEMALKLAQKLQQDEPLSLIDAKV